ncbi:MAG: ABC transporter substrate-binding protein [Spirochaetaceae bacterium]|jgi:branched-chain amino acid transport system substrate-binding protein|nr:ABC transporter substrate-binding protein [Spirochaetaceae bacterium]
MKYAVIVLTLSCFYADNDAQGEIMKKIFFVCCACLCALASSCKKGGQENSENAALVIGGIFPLSGPTAVYGIEAKNGIELALDEINAADGINGRQVVLISEDDEGDPEKTVNVYKKLTTKDKTGIIIGSLTSGCTQAIASLCQAQKVLLLAPAATLESITDAGDFVFRACFIDSFQGTVGGIFASSSLNAKKAAVLYDNTNDYSTELMSNFIEAFQEQGGTIISQESYIKGDVDFSAQLTKIKNSNPDAVYIPDYYSTVALIAKQLRAQGIAVPIIGADGWDGLTSKAGDEVTNGFYSNHYSSDSSEPKVINFVKSYQEKFNSIPVSFAALGYDSLYMLKDAIERAGSTDPKAIRDELAKTDGDYVTGTIKFDDHRNPIKAAVMLEIVRDGENLTTVYKTTVQP